MIIWLLPLIIAYLGVGLLVARVWNERKYREEGLGRNDYCNRERTKGEAIDHHIGVGFALTLFWPFVAIAFLLYGFGTGLWRIAKLVYLPTELRGITHD